MIPNPRTLALLAAICLFSVGQAQSAEPTADAGETEQIRVIRAYLEAFNQHNVPALAERVSPDFVWLNVSSDKASVEVKGRDMLRTNLSRYFENTPGIRSEIDGVASAGAYVSFRERATWKTLLGERTQTSLAVYEVKEGLITRAWYYPAAK